MILGPISTENPFADPHLIKIILHGSQPRLDLARMPVSRGSGGRTAQEQPRSAFARLFQQLKRQI